MIVTPIGVLVVALGILVWFFIKRGETLNAFIVTMMQLVIALWGFSLGGYYSHSVLKHLRSEWINFPTFIAIPPWKVLARKFLYTMSIGCARGYQSTPQPFMCSL